jgi:hypothetical protein
MEPVMRTTTAFLAGAATVVVALAAGLGGGMVIANIVSPHQPKPAVETAKLERRGAEPIAKSNAAAEPVSYLAAIQAAATNPVVVSPAPQAQPQQAEPAPQTSSTQAAAVPSEPERGPGSSAQPAVSAQPPTQTTARAASAASDDAQARRDARRAEERRSKAERRQQWAERRRNRDMRDDELREVERSVREDTERSSVLAAEPVSVGTPRIRLFGGDD